RAATSGREEYTRKVRTISGIVQLFARERWLLAPTHRLWLPAVSHKLLRLAAPVLMLAALATNAVLARHGALYPALLSTPVALYGRAAAGGLGRRGPLARVLGVPYMFCLLNGTTLVALCRSLAGQPTVQWTKAAETARSRAA